MCQRSRVCIANFLFAPTCGLAACLELVSSVCLLILRQVRAPYLGALAAGEKALPNACHAHTATSIRSAAAAELSESYESAPVQDEWLAAWLKRSADQGCLHIMMDRMFGQLSLLVRGVGATEPSPLLFRNQVIHLCWVLLDVVILRREIRQPPPVQDEEAFLVALIEPACSPTGVIIWSLNCMGAQHSAKASKVNLACETIRRRWASRLREYPELA
jgi:hypothetical protein